MIVETKTNRDTRNLSLYFMFFDLQDLHVIHGSKCRDKKEAVGLGYHIPRFHFPGFTFFPCNQGSVFLSSYSRTVRPLINSASLFRKQYCSIIVCYIKDT